MSLSSPAVVCSNASHTAMTVGSLIAKIGLLIDSNHSSLPVRIRERLTDELEVIRHCLIEIGELYKVELKNAKRMIRGDRTSSQSDSQQHRTPEWLDFLSQHNTRRSEMSQKNHRLMERVLTAYNNLQCTGQKLSSRLAQSQSPVIELALRIAVDEMAQIYQYLFEMDGYLKPLLLARPQSFYSESSDESQLEVLPDLSGQIKRTSEFAEAQGGYADVWKCTWSSQLVAVKSMRITTKDPEVLSRTRKRLGKEMDVWTQLNHPYVLPLLGTTMSFGRLPSMVCPWLENGSLSVYLRTRRRTLTTRDRMQVLWEAAEGLSYLHSLDIVHGDLTGSNILISDEGTARLCDFGLSSILANIQGRLNVTSVMAGAIRYADPDLFRLENAVSPSKQTDIYSFGSITAETLSGRIPYDYLHSDAQIVIRLHNGHRLRRPENISDSQWAFIQACWDQEPRDRPRIEAVSEHLFKHLTHAIF